VYLILTASKDTYITDKIINSSFRATDSNLGRAGTIDLFKLYDESVISGESAPYEVSRALLKFDYGQIRSLTGSVLNINSPNFKCILKMQDALGTQTVPRNFHLVAYPLSKSFDEGDGRDVSSFGDIDVANFVTASYSGGTVYPWFVSGANKLGLLGSADIDVIGSGNLGSGIEQLGAIQHFDEGTENFEVDVTKIVSATISGQIPDCGFRVSFIPSEEQDTKTRFVKRFGSRHSKNVYLRPTVHVMFDDVIQDNHASFVFDTTGSIFLINYHRSLPSNILSGSSLTPISGQNCLSVTLKTGSFTKTVFASSYTGSTTGQGLDGVYQTSFAIPYSDSSIVIGSSSVSDFAAKSGSLKFLETWHSNDGKIGFYTGTLEIQSPYRSAFSSVPRKPTIAVTNLLGSYKTSDIVKVRLFGVDSLNYQNRPAKSLINAKSEVFENLFYRVVDADLGTVVIPYTRSNNATRCSIDSDGMYFNFRMSSLYSGRVYYFEFLLADRGVEFQIEEKSPMFRVDAS